MDIISSYQLQQYEGILEEINCEFEKLENLKKEIQRADDRITFLKLSLSRQQKISHVNVKIFSSVAEIVNLFDCDVNHCDIRSISKCNSDNFFLIEVILSRGLLTKLLDSSWRLQISLRCDSLCISKTLPLSDKSSIFEVIPVSAGVQECTVDTSLFYCFENEWTVIDLKSINVDVSYYFESYKERTSFSLLEHYLNITRLYNEGANLGCVSTPTNIRTQMKCNFDKNNFVATFVRNSYHRLNLESFSEFVNDRKRVIDLQFCVSDKKVVVLYNKDTKVLKIKCSPCIMLLIKKFFLKHSLCDYEEFRKKLESVKSKKDSFEDMDLNETLLLYQEVRKLWL